MQTAATHVDDVNQQVQSRLQTLQTQVENAMAGWKGTGSSSWQSLMQRYDQDARDLNTVLHTIAERMRGNQAKYQKVQGDVAAGSKKIASQLKGR